MRISRLYAAALVAAILTAGAPATASAQVNVRRSHLVTHERTEAQVAAFQGLNADLNALFDAQRAFRREHGRWAASFDELPGFSVRPESQLVLTAGPEWYVAVGGDEQMGTAQQIVHPSGEVPVEAVQAARADARGAVLNPVNTVTAGG
ncbi:MAG TPA: hypothetical protein VE871_04470 [Longimicrobium sp.]|nr:hypothetical protein [Longimicrobium sp.]